MHEIKQRAFNAMAGMAIGEALSWPAMYQRSYLYPFWTRRIRREMDAASENDNVMNFPKPFSLNQPQSNFNLSPAINTEWGAFTAEILLKSDESNFNEICLNEWNKLANSEEKIRGFISTIGALKNIKNGLKPPQSGRENPHYYDDGALCRGAVIGAFYSGRYELAAKAAEADASITNYEDGVWGAKAMAAAVSLLCAGKNIDEAIDTSLKYLPEKSWIWRSMMQTLELTSKADSLFQILPELNNNIINREYSYGNSSTETLPIAFAIALMHGYDFESAVSMSALFPKLADTLPAVTGALAGSMRASLDFSSGWQNSIKYLKGISIPSCAGKDYLELARQISEKAGKKGAI